jgi:hypothetical protein
MHKFLQIMAKMYNYYIYYHGISDCFYVLLTTRLKLFEILNHLIVGTESHSDKVKFI